MDEKDEKKVVKQELDKRRNWRRKTWNRLLVVIYAHSIGIMLFLACLLMMVFVNTSFRLHIITLKSLWKSRKTTSAC